MPGCCITTTIPTIPKWAQRGSDCHCRLPIPNQAWTCLILGFWLPPPSPPTLTALTCRHHLPILKSSTLCSISEFAADRVPNLCGTGITPHRLGLWHLRIYLCHCLGLDSAHPHIGTFPYYLSHLFWLIYVSIKFTTTQTQKTWQVWPFFVSGFFYESKHQKHGHFGHVFDAFTGPHKMQLNWPHFSCLGSSIISCPLPHSDRKYGQIGHVFCVWVSLPFPPIPTWKLQPNWLQFSCLGFSLY